MSAFSVYLSDLAVRKPHTFITFLGLFVFLPVFPIKNSLNFGIQRDHILDRKKDIHEFSKVPFSMYF